MKKTFATFIAIVLTVAGLHAFRAMQQSGIKGQITPPVSTLMVIAINGTDTVKTKPVNGTFAFTVKPGSWKVWIDAGKPLKDVVLDATVKDGEMTNLGEIKLLQ